MKTESEILINQLVEITKQLLNDAEDIMQLPLEKLKNRPHPNGWNALECFEHLNRYGDFYLPLIDKKIKNSNHPSEKYFKSGFLGNYFAESMLPKEKLNKMKTFKDKDPIGCDLRKETIEVFIHQQKTMLELLDKARKANLNKIKTPISITRFIKLKLGDTFRFVIHHNLRHIVQAKRAVS